VFDTEEISDILNFSADQLRAKLGQEQGSWVYNTIRGIDYSEVNTRTKIKSMLRYLSPTPSFPLVPWCQITVSAVHVSLYSCIIHGTNTKCQKLPTPYKQYLPSDPLAPSPNSRPIKPSQLRRLHRPPSPPNSNNPPPFRGTY
jgi:hypothetical protein